jgi:hypothetical protein
VLPVLMASGVEASRTRPDKGTVITLRRVPTPNASNASMGESRPDKGDMAGNTDEANAISNARFGSNAISNASENPAKQAGSGNTGNRSEDVSEAVAAFLSEPPAWYTRQAEECIRQGTPERLLRPLGVAVAYHVLGNTHRWAEVLPHIEATLKDRDGT